MALLFLTALATLASANVVQHEPLRFEPNVGQASLEARYVVRGGSRTMLLTDRGSALQFGSAQLRMNLSGAAKHSTALAEGRLPSVTNYYLGDDPKHWYPGVPNYERVKFEQVYPGIDLVYYGNQQALEYDFLLQPGADPEQIRLAWSGADSMRLDAGGDLVLTVQGHELRQRKPIVYQQVAGKHVEIESGYELLKGGTVRLAVAAYDRELPLVVDPVLWYSTYLGGAGYAGASRIAVDSTGAAYVTGCTSDGFPTLNAEQANYGGGIYDVFVTKFSPAGALVYSTYLGGPNRDMGAGIALDSTGAAYVTGITEGGFPTLNAEQPNYGGGPDSPANGDAFVAKLSPAGILVYSTYLGGPKWDVAEGIAVDNTGAAYVSGFTEGSFPVLNAEQPAFGGGKFDAFVAKFSPTGALVYSTYLGGPGPDQGGGIAVDSTGAAYVTGSTGPGFPTLNAEQPAYGGGVSDAFVTKLGPAGALVYSTYLGGPSQEQGGGIAVDSTGAAYVTGLASEGFPILNAAQPIYGGGPFDAYVAKLSPDGALVYSTYLGGPYQDSGNGIAVDGTGSAYVSGTYNFAFGIPEFAFAAKFSPDGALIYFTDLGGPNASGGGGIAVDSTGAAYVAGSTGPGFPTFNAEQPVFGGSSFSGFVVKLSSWGPTVSPQSGAGQSQTFTFTFPDPDGYADIAGAQIVINSTLTAVNSCYILFARPDKISLASDSGVSFTTNSLGSPSVLQNSQCVVLSSQTTQSGSGNTVTLNLTVAFKPGFAGPKSVWADYNTNAGVNTGWLQSGSYTANPPAQVITVGAVDPNTGSGPGQAFTFKYFDAYGAPDISGAQMVFNCSLSGTNACYILFSGLNQVSLAADNAQTFTTAVLGQLAVLQNTQCTVFTGNSYQTQNGQNLAVTLFIAFKPAFAGTVNIYSSANTNGNLITGYSTLGKWTIPASAPSLAIIPVQYNIAGPGQALTFVFEDSSGYADIFNPQMIITPSYPFGNDCIITYTPSTQTIALPDDQNGYTTATIGQPRTLQNSVCIVNAAASTQFASGNYLVLTLFVSIRTSADQTVFAQAVSSSANILQTVGYWGLTMSTRLAPVSVTPLTGETGVGNFQYFTFTMSDPPWADDLSGALFVLNGALQGANSCYILWGSVHAQLSLASDDAKSFTSGNLGAPGLLSNSQCTVDTSKSFVTMTHDIANLTIAISFKQPYTAFTGGFYTFVNVETKAGVFSGWQVESRFTVQ